MKTLIAVVLGCCLAAAAGAFPTVAANDNRRAREARRTLKPTASPPPPPAAGSADPSYRGNKPWRTLAALFWPERGQLALSTALFLVKHSPVWVLPILTANIIDILSAPARHGLAALWWNVGASALLIVQNISTHTAHVNALSRAVRHVETRLRAALCRHLQQLSISYYKHASTGMLQSKVLRDVENLGLAAREIIGNGLASGVTILVVLGVTLWRVPWFVPVFLLTTPLAALLHALLRRRLARANRAFRQEVEGMNTRVLGMISMIPVTRAHAVEEDELAQVKRRLDQVQAAGLQLDAQNGIVNSAGWVVFTLFGLGGLALGAWLCYRRILPLTPGDVVLMSGYCNTLSGSVMGLVNTLPTISRGMEAVRSVGEVMECPDIEENVGKRRVGDVRGAFDFQAVAFTYPGQDAPAVADFSLRVEPGETVGIVGASGSGKSTLMSLLLGFHRPGGGRVLLDGEDMNAIDLRTYRQRLAVVSQETILFDGTLRDNVLYGSGRVDERRLRAALEDANAAEFVAALPRGLDTLLGERGARLSGGQRQRIAIARALIRDPRVLILDEATSALDAHAEAAVQEALDRLMAGRTTFIVAHRLSTLRRAGRIAVLEAGRLVEIGRPEELLRRRDGAFARLHALQALRATA